MAKANVIARWTEMSETVAGPGRRPGGWDAWLFTNDCEVRWKGKSHQKMLQRSIVPRLFEGATKDEVLAKIAEFIQRDDVRLLRPKLASNDFKVLPLQMIDPPADVIDGTAEIYADKATIGQSADAKLKESSPCQ